MTRAGHTLLCLMLAANVLYTLPGRQMKSTGEMLIHFNVLRTIWKFRFLFIPVQTVLYKADNNVPFPPEAPHDLPAR